MRQMNKKTKMMFIVEKVIPAIELANVLSTAAAAAATEALALYEAANG